MHERKEVITIPGECIAKAKSLSGYALDVLKMKPRQRDKLLLKLTKDGQAEYLHAIFSAKNMLELEAKSGQLLTAAIGMGYEDVVDVLLHHGADPNEVKTKNYLELLRRQGRSQETRLRIMQKAVKTGYDLSEHIEDLIVPMFEEYALHYSSPAKDMLVDFFEMGVDYQSVKRACLKNKKEIYCRDLDEQYKQYQNKQNRLEKEPVEQNSADVSGNLNVGNDMSWHVMGGNTIALVQNIDVTKTSIQTVFNFEAYSVTTIVQVAEAQPHIHVRNFNEVENPEQLKTAFNKLSEISGKENGLRVFEADYVGVKRKTTILPKPRLQRNQQN